MADKIAHQIAHFDAIAPLYRRAREGRNHLFFKDLMWREFLRDKDFLRRPGLAVLEPMCGYADGRRLLERHLGVAIDYRGFDYSGAVVDSLRRSDPGLAVERRDVTRYTPERAYDLVILLGGLHHVPGHAGDVVARLAGGLGPGGAFISFEPIDPNPAFRALRARIYRRNALFDAETERAFAWADYVAMFRDAGLRLVDCLYPGLLAYALYYNPDAFPRLNVGGPGMVRALWRLERPLRLSGAGRLASFAALTLWQRPVVA